MISVLYVDDDPGLLEIGKLFLEAGGEFVVDTLMSAHEALKRLDTTRYDAIIADCAMQGTEGVGILQSLRASGDTTPFIIFTGRGSEEMVIEALNNGADFYLRKGGEPATQFAVLAKNIRSAVMRRRVLKSAMWIGDLFEHMMEAVAYCRMIFDEHNNPIDFIYLEVNSAFGRLTGLNNVVGKKISEVVPGIRELNPAMFEISGRVALTGNPEKFEHLVQPLNLWLSASMYSPKTGYFVAIFDNITERKKAEEELQTAYEQIIAAEEEMRAQYDFLALGEAEWKSTFDAISDWITLITPEGQILRTNTASESVMGIPSGQILGMKCFELVHGIECPAETCPRRRMLISRKREVTEIPKRDGNGWLQVTVDPVINAEGVVVSAVHIVRDITERTRSQKALEQAKKKLSLLNYMTFDDTQKMIFTFSAYQHLIKGRVTDTSACSLIEKQEDILQKITQSMKFAQSYQDLGIKPSQWQNANHVFLMAISHLDFLKINHTLQIKGLEIFADPLLEQVFQILADNTLAHGKTATQVTLRYTEHSGSLTLVYEDNGVGIPEETKNKIFLPDFQKKKGVGLFLAGEILDITGIIIRETGEPGKGARFEMVVPKGMWRMDGNGA
jgi:PAS domain S-box-containing protein